MMGPIHCLIVDDKPLAIDILTDYVAKVPCLQLAGSSENPVEALNWVGERRVDLVFLDIQMPQLTGLQFMHALDRRAQVILTTAYADYALTGFEHDVIDYLLKPIPFERFHQAVQKAQRRLRPAPAETSRPYLFVKTEHRMQRVDLADVLYLEGLQNYVIIHTTTEKIITRQTLNSLEASLPAAAFVRVHKSFIVSLAHIHTVERSRIFIQVEAGVPQIIPVGDAYRTTFYSKL
ncbi:two component transcriptional regulator, LytTR family [Hymenobacter roseosalivarius DSM 11622]|uniref:Two component transcriptional regulator, LytTR family n=1 Tax=Hymenobacter roseosalivarius DSM 11622 TaxID=645990 RepID=A0A1W1W5F8_9BACT|nr:response regulator transcription factor [Hymenobacter roseosalivarius]SMC00700.1 two component transcriptional regulator, LytTR family [Hymenobacter roseosalivarius DSM 11622]